MILENLRSWKKLSCVIVVLGGLQFIILTLIAMFFYPGGYSFVDHYFSNLGTTITVENYKPNTISRTLFVIACILVGISLIPFWIVITTMFADEEISRYLSYFGSLLGIIASPLLMLAGIFPGDKSYAIHALTARYFFLFFASAILIYSIAILLKSDYNIIYALVGFGLSILIVLYIYRAFILINPLMQKIIVYGLITWSGIQVVHIWKTVSSEE